MDYKRQPSTPQTQVTLLALRASLQVPAYRSHQEGHETDNVLQAVCFSKAGVYHRQSPVQLLA